MWNNGNPAPSYMGGMPPPSSGFDSTAMSVGTGAPPGGNYGAPPGGNYMGAGPPGGGYGAPGPYGAAPPSPGGNYGAVSMGGPPGGNYGAPPPSGNYMGGAPPPASNYGAQPQMQTPPNPYGAPSGYMGAPPPSGNYGPPPGGNYGAPGGNYGAAPPAGPPGGYMGGQPGGGYGAPVAARTGNAHMLNTGGKRRAVIIGINYLRSNRGRLRGCINDANNISRFISEHFGFRDIRLMTDDSPPNSPNHPTKQNMINAMNWLVADAQPGDSFFFHFSGHGGQSEDKTHMEDDGLNETILPADWESVGMIVDDDLHNMLVRNLPEGSRFTAIFDSCHSGTALDLPYLYKVQSGQFKNAHKAEEDRFWGRHKAKAKKTKVSGIGGAAKMFSSHVTGEVSHQVKKKVRKGIMEQRNTTKAIVVMFSGCRDDQTSADATMANQATGAMSYSFMETLKRNQGNISYADLLAGMRDVLHNGAKKFTQLPQLSYGRPMDMSQSFTM